jgi:hypothetical protein
MRLLYKDQLKKKDVDLKTEFAAPKQNEPFLSVNMEKENLPYCQRTFQVP